MKRPITEEGSEQDGPFTEGDGGQEGNRYQDRRDWQEGGGEEGSRQEGAEEDHWRQEQ
ncbi:MAG: hypothetical protein ACLPVF_10560 [Acidimicrobiales bacterium]